MEFEIAKSKSYETKIALAIAIIRSKPAHIDLIDYVYLLQATFYTSYRSNSEKILSLKKLLLEARRELFLMQNKEMLERVNNQDEIQIDSSYKALTDKFEEMKNKQLRLKVYENSKMKLKKNIEFLTNLIKLKSVGKNFKINDTSNDLILKCLSELLKQIYDFFFKSNLIVESFDRQDFDEIASEIDMTEVDSYSFPISIDSLLHSVQVFLNVFDIEWLYYLRQHLILDIEKFIDDLIAFIFNFQINEKVFSLYL
jgi:hypothetical protein